MKWLKRLPMLVVMVLALCLTSVPAYAHEVPDASRRGTISVTMAYDGTRVPGGSVTLYRVGDVVSDDGNYIFTLTSECAASGVSLDDLESPEAAQALADWAVSHGLSGVTVPVGDDGVATFTDVALGLYVMVQHDPATGYYAIDPFLIGMPLTEDGSYVYDIDASPKLELEKKPTPPPTEEENPETGEAELPIVPLLVGGVVVCVAAALLIRRKGDSADK